MIQKKMSQEKKRKKEVRWGKKNENNK